MTFGKLKDAVARLGFERELEDSEALMPALYRALQTIYTDRPIESYKRLVKPTFSGKLILSYLEHDPARVEQYKLSGCAISMVLSGSGTYTISSAFGSETKSFDSPYYPVRTRIKKDSVIEFSGECAYSVLSLAAFDSLRSEDISELPLYDERNDLKLKELIPDLLTLSEPLSDGQGNAIHGVKQRGDTVTLPDGYCGEIVVSYNRSPIMPGGLDADEPIDIPAECAELLPLLVASYVWLEDSPETAQYYFSLYQNGMESLRRRMPRRGGTAKYDTNGWA